MVTVITFSHTCTKTTFLGYSESTKESIESVLHNTNPSNKYLARETFFFFFFGIAHVVFLALQRESKRKQLYVVFLLHQKLQLEKFSGHTTGRMYLLHLCCSAPKQLNITLPEDLFVFLQRILGILFTGKEHKSVTSGSPIWVLNKQETLGAICNWALRTKEGQHVLWCGSEW